MSSTWPPGAEGVGEVGSPIGEVVLDTWCQVLVQSAWDQVLGRSVALLSVAPCMSEDLTI